MGRGPRYRVSLKRRRMCRTDYRRRKNAVLSKTPRLVVRGSLKNILAQVVEALPSGDRTLTAANSSELVEHGWKVPCGNVPAAYLTGLIIGLKAQPLGIKQVTLDIGLRRPSPGSRVFAVLKGAMDSGLNVPCGEVLPKESRIRGEHIASYAKELVEAESNEYKRRFSEYLSKGLKPEELPTHFDEVRSNILHAFKKEG